MLSSAWGSPVLQGFNGTCRIRPIASAPVAFAFGAAASIAALWVLAAVHVKGSAFETMGLAVFLPGFVAQVVCFIRLAGPMLVRMPLRLRELVSPDKPDPLLTVPISDHEMFNGLALRPILVGHRLLDETIGFSLGLLFGYLLRLVLDPTMLRFWGDGIIFLSVLYLWGLGSFVWALVLLAPASGAMALRFPMIASVPLAILYVIIASLVALVVGSQFTSGSGSPDSPFVPLLVAMAGQCMLYWFAVYTAVSQGVELFSSARRPGWYRTRRVS